MTQTRKPGRPKGSTKEKKRSLATSPEMFNKDDEFGLTEMQAAFVWHYTEGACAQTEAARRAGYEFPASAANKMLNGKDMPHVTKAIRVKQDELAQKYAITPQKTGTMLWKLAEEAFENGSYNASVSAIKELNNLAGLSINRTQNLNINANLDAMNKDDIKKRLGKLLGVDDDLKPTDL
tara:strand:+ start:2993 stop:3529 length:537 start_codon:yes stop_codon:yes gene_type:complete